MKKSVYDLYGVAESDIKEWEPHLMYDIYTPKLYNGRKLKPITGVLLCELRRII